MISFLCTRTKISVINLFTIMRFRYFKVNYHSYYWVKKIVCYTEDLVI